MQADHRPRVSIPLSHDHFGSGAKRPNSAASSSDTSAAVDAPTLPQRATGETLRRVSHVARQALKMGKNLTTQTIAATRWSGEKWSLLATKLKARIVRNTATPTGVADRLREPPQYATLPNGLSALDELPGEQHALIPPSPPDAATPKPDPSSLRRAIKRPIPT